MIPASVILTVLAQAAPNLSPAIQEAAQVAVQEAQRGNVWTVGLVLMVFTSLMQAALSSVMVWRLMGDREYIKGIYDERIKDDRKRESDSNERQGVLIEVIKDNSSTLSRFAERMGDDSQDIVQAIRDHDERMGEWMRTLHATARQMPEPTNPHTTPPDGGA